MNASGCFSHTTAILVYKLPDCVLPQLNPSRLDHDSHNLITAVPVFITCYKTYLHSLLAVFT